MKVLRIFNKIGVEEWVIAFHDRNEAYEMETIFRKLQKKFQEKSEENAEKHFWDWPEW